MWKVVVVRLEVVVKSVIAIGVTRVAAIVVAILVVGELVLLFLNLLPVCDRERCFGVRLLQMALVG